MKKLILAIAMASILTGCAPCKAVLGVAECSVWNEAILTVDGKGIVAEYAAGFADAYSAAHGTRGFKYRWVIDSATDTCAANPSETIQDALTAAVKQFEK